MVCASEFPKTRNCDQIGRQGELRYAVSSIGIGALKLWRTLTHWI